MFTMAMQPALEWHEYLGAVLDSEGICRGAVIHDLKTDEIYTLSLLMPWFLATGGPWSGLWQVYQLRRQYWSRSYHRIFARRKICQRGIHPDSPYRYSRSR